MSSSRSLTRSAVPSPSGSRQTARRGWRRQRSGWPSSRLGERSGNRRASSAIVPRWCTCPVWAWCASWLRSSLPPGSFSFPPRPRPPPVHPSRRPARRPLLRRPRVRRSPRRSRQARPRWQRSPHRRSASHRIPDSVASEAASLDAISSATAPAAKPQGAEDAHEVSAPEETLRRLASVPAMVLPEFMPARRTTNGGGVGPTSHVSSRRGGAPARRASHSWRARASGDASAAALTAAHRLHRPAAASSPPTARFRSPTAGAHPPTQRGVTSTHEDPRERTFEPPREERREGTRQRKTPRGLLADPLAARTPSFTVKDTPRERQNSGSHWTTSQTLPRLTAGRATRVPARGEDGQDGKLRA